MKKITLVALMAFLSFYSVAQTIYLHCGKLIDVEKSEVLTEMTLIVDGDKIKSVEKGYKDVPSNAKASDLKSKTGMPGLFDMHVHIEFEISPDYYMGVYTLNEADIAFQSTVYASRTLMAGFTSVRDLGGTGVNSSLRDAINKGLVVGPTIYSAGKAIATTGGHADPTNGYKADLMGVPGPNEGVINGSDEAREAVRQRYKNGADVIKITATGGVLSVAKNGQSPQFFEDELKAIVETANDYGMLTAAHAQGFE